MTPLARLHHLLPLDAPRPVGPNSWQLITLEAPLGWYEERTSDQRRGRPARRIFHSLKAGNLHLPRFERETPVAGLQRYFRVRNPAL